MLGKMLEYSLSKRVYFGEEVLAEDREEHIKDDQRSRRQHLLQINFFRAEFFHF